MPRRVPKLTPAESERRIRELRKQGCKVRKVETSMGTVVLKKCPSKFSQKEANKIIRTCGGGRRAR